MTIRTAEGLSRGSDRGAALILVIGIAGVVFALVATGVAFAISAIEQSRRRSDFELALVAAEAGIDQTLARLQFAYDNAPGGQNDFPVPGTQADSACVDTPVTIPSEFETTEDAWAREELTELRATHPECLVTTESGQYLVLKPPSGTAGGGRVYAIGWAPAQGAPDAAERLLKSEYLFMPFKPAHAVLTNGDLEIDASATVTTAAGFDPALGGVHSNGSITSANGNPQVSGIVTSTEASSASSTGFNPELNPGGRVQQVGSVSVPTVNAAAFYRQAPQMDTLAVTAFGYWHDLCPDGTVRAYATTGEPCSTSAVQYEGLTGVSYEATSRTWTISRDAPMGVYYAHHANVVNGNGNATFPNLTVVASAENPTDCATKRYGNISWDHYDMQAPAVTNLFLYADADLVTSSNFAAGNDGQNGSAVIGGMFVAGDQLSLNTASQAVVGAALAADQCDSGAPSENVVKNLKLYYDPDAKSPFTSVINQTLWLEY